MVTKKIIMLTTTGAATLALAGVIGLSAVSAANGATGTSLADKIATAFHLNSADVQKVLDQNHADHEATKDTNYATRVSQLVAAGKITSTQKDLLIAKHKELETARDADRTNGTTLTNAERKAKRDAERTALDTWAKDNGISVQYLMMGGRGHGGWGGGHDRDDKPAASSTSTTTN
jgi:flagellar motor protein MotB